MGENGTTDLPASRQQLKCFNLRQKFRALCNVPSCCQAMIHRYDSYAGQLTSQMLEICAKEIRKLQTYLLK